MARGIKTEELLNLVADEYSRAVGIRGDEINGQRMIGLNYYKGVMDDVPAPEGRSSAKSSDVADAIETVLPDLLEIFTGSDDVATFTPNGPEDEEASIQETDYINHVFFEENSGFQNLYTMIKDALQEKTGILKAYGDWNNDPDEEFEGQPLEAYLVALQQYGDRVVLDTEGLLDEEGNLIVDELTGMPVVETVDFTIKGEKHFKACVCAVPPEDFAVSQDTVELHDAPYVAHRSRLRAYDLLRRGIPKSVVDKLPAYGIVQTEIRLARDTSDTLTAEEVGAWDEWRIVEIVEHFIDTKRGRIRMVTDGSCQIVIEKPEKHERVPFAAICPFPVAHQFYGQSLADKLIEIQRIKTSLLRMLMDSGYFALNQRNAVNMKAVNQWTMADLMRNEPNVPIRVDGPVGEAIQPMTSGGLNFPVMETLGFVDVMGELRSGVMRNQQGLDGGTLHETASGAMALMDSAQRRLRLIARIFAETGIKDIFLLLHDLIRENATGAAKAKLRGKWVEIDPTKWGSRKDMTIEIGVGSSNKMQQQALLDKSMEFAANVFQLQGGANGPLMTMENYYALAKRYVEKGLEFKSADAYLTDPADAPPQEPQLDPAMMEAQAKAQIEQQKIEAQMEHDQAKLAMERERAAAQIETERMKADAQLQLERDRAAAAMEVELEKAQLQMQIAREKAQMELQLARDKAAAEAELAAWNAEVQADLAQQQIASSERVGLSKNRPGGDLDK